MAIIVSRLVLSKFMDCPVDGAHAVHPSDDLTAHVDPPVNTVLPVVTGDLTVGSMLTVTTGTWTSTKPITYTYQWKRDGVPIAGATTNTYYIVTEADIGGIITVTVTATNMAGSASVTVPATGSGGGVDPVPVAGLLNSHLPRVTGILKIGETLTTDNGGWVGEPPITFAYSWQRDGVDIPGAASNTYLLVAADVGHFITSRVVATNATASESAYSADMGPVASPIANVTLPVISGAIVVGQTITTTNGTWTGYPAPTFAYQWKRNGVAISGATFQTYVLVTADIGAMITVTVTATNPVNSISVTSSNSLGPIAAAAILNLSNTSVLRSAVIGSTVGVLSVANGTGSYTYTLTSNPGGLFVISGANLNVAATLSIGSYLISIQATGGLPSPVSNNFTINVISGVTWDPITVANTVLSGGNLIATNTGTTSNDQGARV